MRLTREPNRLVARGDYEIKLVLGHDLFQSPFGDGWGLFLNGRGSNSLVQQVFCALVLGVGVVVQIRVLEHKQSRIVFALFRVELVEHATLGGAREHFLWHVEQVGREITSTGRMRDAKAQIEHIAGKHGLLVFGESETKEAVEGRDSLLVERAIASQ